MTDDETKSPELLDVLFEAAEKWRKTLEAIANTKTPPTIHINNSTASKREPTADQPFKSHEDLKPFLAERAAETQRLADEANAKNKPVPVRSVAHTPQEVTDVIGSIIAESAITESATKLACYDAVVRGGSRATTTQTTVLESAQELFAWVSSKE